MSLSHRLGHRLGRQLREPRGWAGRLTGLAMRVVNDECNRLAVEALAIHATDTVLEVGCGPGHGLALAAAQAPNGRLYGVDRSAVMLEQAAARNRGAVRSGRLVLTTGAFDALPFADRSMDKVLAVNVAYFWDREGRVAREIRRVLRPSGTLALYVTDRATMAHWPFAGADTHIHWDEHSLASMLHAGGFPQATIEVWKVRLRGGVQGLVAVATTP
ncbi:Methyltransferase domain-containing protein [Enhydrobacter aerosaccus]|uniref:Methyltransferase domain-containing protein n=1 Tax=Enhydrobacter aerosaccus TaxID=225324 RepID=A0A1T4R3K8_9HYPH|nr:class I SAM-dependent methyltransferase [Enhydrobacter aerosaccus]SKA10642.1 Methyltransferase domain-containing protein [Enhydrobacter aerosaccus]